MNQKTNYFVLVIFCTFFLATSLFADDTEIQITDTEEKPQIDNLITLSHQGAKDDTLKRIEVLINKSRYLRWRISGFELMNNITADSFSVFRISDKPILILKKNEDKRYPIASITKLMSAIVTSENVDPNRIITLSTPMLQTYGYSPSLFPGAKVTAKDLMMASLIQSTNDASESLTYFMDKGTFLGLMNIKAHQIGMRDSFFFDSHGLSPNNQSTVIDIATMLNYIYQNNPEILGITKIDNFQLPNPYGRLLTFKNLNMFHNIPDFDFIGGKTGYLPEAKQTYACLFNVNNETYAVVILMSNSRKNDLEAIFEWLNKKPEKVRID